ncbi:hypothetical protein H1R20_g15212, partial [Candolleomyces eurysporus]
MTLPNRADMLDACMADINWRKLQTLVPFLIRQHKRASEELESARKRFASYDNSTSPQQRLKWRYQIDQANKKRLENPSDPSSMDILNPSTMTIESRLTVQICLMRDEKEKNSLVGTAGWLSAGIAIQDQHFSQAPIQILIFPNDRLQARVLVEGYHKSPTQARELELEKKRESILTKLNDLYSRAATLFPSVKFDRMKGGRPDVHDVCTCEESCGCFAREKDRPWEDGKQVEYAVVPLPSSFDNVPSGWDPLIKKEIDLRVAQANEALENLRSDIVNKSYLYRANRGLAKGKRERTRGYDTINLVETSMQLNAQRYKLAKWALKRLAAVTAIYDPNKPGLRTDDLSWIWRLNVKKDSETHDQLEEVHRVNWIRSLNIRDRWEEELTIVTAEIEWYVRYMFTRKREVLCWIKGESDLAVDAYAYRQADMWHRLGIHASSEFIKIAKVTVLVD